MKIYFGKHECDYFLGDALSCENAKWVNTKYNYKRGNRITLCVTGAIAIIYAAFFLKQINSAIAVLAIAYLLLPVHEFCHTLFAGIFGNGAEGIYFRPPYKEKRISNPSAYVCLNPVLWNKTKQTLFVLFPLILLSVLPLVLSIIFRNYAVWLIYIALNNLTMSFHDINAAIHILKFPRNTLFLRQVRLLPKDATKPTQIHYIYVRNEKGEIKVFHEHYEYFEGKSKRIEPPVETEDAMFWKNDLLEKLGFDINS
ncbi:MAG: DUF3267 domain-containing protein [Clostridia bacterium]|nr:DUF3267 domain-containing protein [Clostridia bacterium]